MDSVLTWTQIAAALSVGSGNIAAGFTFCYSGVTITKFLNDPTLDMDLELMSWFGSKIATPQLILFFMLR